MCPTDALRRAVQNVMEVEPIPGLTLAFLNNKRVSAESFGVIHFGEPQSVTDQTIFSAASLTKPLIAYLALQFVDQGLLTLDTPLRHYLTQPYLSGEPRADSITLRHILSHQSGFPNWRSKGSPLALQSAPGEHFSYSGEGYVYLQHCLGYLSGQPLDVLLHKWLLQPLAMSSSSLIWQSFMAGRAASGHDADKSWNMPHHDTPNSAYSLYTTILDYARFVQFLLTGETDAVSSSIHLSPKLREQMFTSHVQVGKWPNLFWGLGWGIQSTVSGPLFWHWGANPGYRSYVAFSRNHRMGVIILTNHQNGLDACRYIIAHLDEPSLNIEHPAFDWLLPSHSWTADGRRNQSSDEITS